MICFLYTMDHPDSLLSVTPLDLFFASMATDSTTHLLFQTEIGLDPMHSPWLTGV